MKTQSRLLLALFLGAAASLSAKVGPTYGDLIVGFSASSGTGAGTDLEVDVGHASDFMSAAAGTYTLANLAADLSATYGNWQNDGALSYSVVGSTSPTFGTPYAPTGTVWATSAEPAGPAGGFATGYAGAGSGAYTSANNAIKVYYGATLAPGAFGGNGTTSLADVNAQQTAFHFALTGITTPGSLSGSYAAQLGAANPGFALPAAPGVAIATAANANAANASADLFELLPTSAVGSPQVDYGYFTLSSAGVLTYTVRAVPEPSLAAALLAAAAAAGAGRRGRRRTFDSPSSP